MKNIKPTSKLLCIVCFFVAYFLSIKTNATHITGGELSYESIGTNTYKITLKIYRDCMNGEAGFDDPAKITVWDGNPTMLEVLEIPFTGSTAIPYVAADTNWVPVGYQCVEVATYISTVVLPQSITGYTFAYQRCCRTGNIVNLNLPLETGSTYWEKVPEVDYFNNSPVFNNHPPLVLCLNRPMTFDHSATDLDGDSLVYRLCKPFDGASQSDPQPYVTSPPPFSNVTFLSPYTESYPMFASPNFSIDSITGIVTVTPWAMGCFEVGICCDEYRNGILIGTHHSDFRYTVAECPYGIGVEEESTIKVELFPNPTTDIIQIKAGVDMNVMMFDMLGKLVYQSTNENQTQMISMVSFPQGIYTYKVVSAFGYASGIVIKN